MTDMTSFVFRIQKYSVHDGPGIRTTLFFQGCPLSCLWCHNPESRARARGVPDLAVISSLVGEMEKDQIFYDDSGGGVTFSGGEPLAQPNLLFALADACREREIHTCLDTSGFAPFEVLKAGADRVDLVLYDIKIVDERHHQDCTGKSSRRILNNLKKLSDFGARVHLRFPLIPGMTDSRENVDSVIEFLSVHTLYRKIHLLPFHNTAAGKYRKLGMPYKLDGKGALPAGQVAGIQKKFTDSGFTAVIGG
jgi:pyruvate formate lyase activating enzyme